MPDYLALESIHVTCAALSIGGYVLRGVWMRRGSPLREAPWVRVVPHAVDTLLLASAIGLVIMLGQYRWTQAWPGAKVAALLAYIGVGAIGLRYHTIEPLAKRIEQRVHRGRRHRPALRLNRAGARERLGRCDRDFRLHRGCRADAQPEPRLVLSGRTMCDVPEALAGESCAGDLALPPSGG